MPSPRQFRRYPTPLMNVITTVSLLVLKIPGIAQSHPETRISAAFTRSKRDTRVSAAFFWTPSSFLTGTKYGLAMSRNLTLRTTKMRSPRGPGKKKNVRNPKWQTRR